MAEDYTYEFGLREKFTNALIDAFMENNTLSIKKTEGADAVCYVKIMDFTKKAGSYTSEEEVNQIKITMKVEVLIKLKKDGKELFKKTIVKDLLYNKGDDELQARDNIIKEISLEVVRRFLSSW